MDARGSGLLAIRYYGYLIVDLYHRWRLHLSLGKDSPETRPVQMIGRIAAFPEVGGLHHRYERVA
jgi:putative transposase